MPWDIKKSVAGSPGKHSLLDVRKNLKIGCFSSIQKILIEDVLWDTLKPIRVHWAKSFHSKSEIKNDFYFFF